VGGLNNMSNNSMAVTFSSSATCLNVQNGTAVLTGDRGTGNFAVNCEVNTIFNSLGIKLFPNPVGANTKVKFINTPKLTDQFSISVWNAEGFQISSSKATGYELFQGKGMDFSSLIAIIKFREGEKYLISFVRYFLLSQNSVKKNNCFYNDSNNHKKNSLWLDCSLMMYLMKPSI
jgi:hypothetical protein